MDHPGKSKRPWFQIGIGALMGLVLLVGLVLGGLQVLIEPYRREWRAEQAALAELRKHEEVLARTKAFGPRWLRVLAGPVRSKYFERTTSIIITGTTWSRYQYRLSHPLTMGKLRQSFTHLDRIRFIDL
jgi:hypothetical protein